LLIKALQVENLRNLKAISITPNPVLNVIVGKNGAGKTSILESLVVLSRGRSFRTVQSTELAGPQSASFTVFAKVEKDNGQTLGLGLERSGKYWKARKNGKDLVQISQLTRSLPIVLMEPNSHLLVSGAPEIRRKYLDWGVFHVEPVFLDTWKRYSKALKQRNAALRRRQSDVIESMNDMISPLGEHLNRLRATYADLISEKTKEIIKELSPGLKDVSFSYNKGWVGDQFIESLQHNLDSDLERGATSAGPHRADLILKIGEKSARALLSRGEHKIVSASMLLAQAGILRMGGERPLILLDDIASEFDSTHSSAVLERFIQEGGQVWLTGTVAPDYSGNHSMFHVERGTVREMV